MLVNHVTYVACVCMSRMLFDLPARTCISIQSEMRVAAGKRRQPCSGTKELPANLDVFKNHPSHSAVSSGAFDVEARSAVSSVFWTWRVGRPTALYFSVFLCSPVPRSEFLANGLDDGTFLQSSPSTGILTNGLDRAFWGGSAQKVSGLVS